MIDAVFVWLVLFFVSTALMYQLRVPGFEIWSRPVSRLADHFPPPVGSIGFEDQVVLPGRR